MLTELSKIHQNLPSVVRVRDGSLVAFDSAVAAAEVAAAVFVAAIVTVDVAVAKPVLRDAGVAGCAKLLV